MNVEIRAATVDDIPAMRAVGAATWPPTYAFAGDEYVAHGLATWWSEEALQRSLQDTEMLVALVDGDLLGVANLDLRTSPPTIWKLYVVPSAHGSGVGAHLLRALITLTDADRVRLEYVDGNARAAAFYAREGFVEVQRTPPDEPGWPDTIWVEWRR